MNEPFDLVRFKSRLDRGVMNPLAAIVESESPRPRTDEEGSSSSSWRWLLRWERFEEEVWERRERGESLFVSNLTERGRDEVEDWEEERRAGRGGGVIEEKEL